MTKRLFTKDQFELVTAYANGYAYGRAGLELDHLWQPEEVKGYAAEELGYYWGQSDLYCFGELEGELA